jgi:CheY-like chemotaxis protein
MKIEKTSNVGGDNQGFLIVSVQDQGLGIQPAEYHKVFGEYSQLQISSVKDRHYVGGSGGQSIGTGLGLNLVLQFVRMMHGHTWFRNCSNERGAIFSFCIPAVEEPALTEHADESDEEPTRDEIARIHNLKLMIVEDCKINLKVLSRMVLKAGVQSCEMAGNGRIALDYLLTTADPLPDIMLIDLQMPVMGGLELVEHLRGSNLPTSPLLVACTADWSGETEKNCLENGFDFVLRKPITFTDLSSFLARFVRDQSA